MTLINNDVRATFFPIKTVPYYKLFEKQLCWKEKKKAEKRVKIYTITVQIKKKISGHIYLMDRGSSSVQFWPNYKIDELSFIIKR